MTLFLLLVALNESTAVTTKNIYDLLFVYPKSLHNFFLLFNLVFEYISYVSMHIFAKWHFF